MGDPAGIGPEVLVKALADEALRGRARYVVLGIGSAMERAAALASIVPYWEGRGPGAGPGVEFDPGAGVTLLDDEMMPGAGQYGPFAPVDSALGGGLSFAWVEAAADIAKGNHGFVPRADAMVTGPISKAAWAMSGEFKHPGHTGLLAARFGVMRYAMMFVAPLLRVILVTDHLALKHVPRAVTSWLVRDIIELGAGACVELGVESPRLAVCGLNPHAGERGMMGSEDDEDIRPGIEQAREKGIDVEGPFPADTIFNVAVDRPGKPRKYDLVVAMYHDQGLIPVKLLCRDSAVNVTVGLPVPRTSPDHGTAYDIAHQNKANAGSMAAALGLAVDMAERKGKR